MAASKKTVTTTPKRVPRKKAPAQKVVIKEVIVKEQGFFGSITDFDSDTHINMEMRVSSTAKKVVAGAALIGVGVVVAKLI